MALIESFIINDCSMATTALVAVALLCTRIAYLLWFHPLARFPGPWTHRISGLSLLYHCWKGDVHIHTWHLHQRYGG
jgi:hypothetical protein